jgi:hypothetical protein
MKTGENHPQIPQRHAGFDVRKNIAPPHLWMDRAWGENLENFGA